MGIKFRLGVVVSYANERSQGNERILNKPICYITRTIYLLLSNIGALLFLTRVLVEDFYITRELRRRRDVCRAVLHPAKYYQFYTKATI